MLAEILGVRMGAGDMPGGGPRLAPKQAKHLEADSLVDAADRLDPASYATEREALARRALAVSKDHAAAWCVLGDQALNADDAVVAFETAIAAGERFLGKAVLARHGNAIANVPGGIGLLRASRGLADALSASGRKAEAIDAAERLIAIDGDDATRVRSLLLALSIGERRWKRARQVLAHMERSTGPAGDWGAALLEFAEHGDGPAARDWLAAAVRANPHVAACLLGDVSFGEGVAAPSLMAAAEYAEEFRSAWLDVPGAVAWLRASIDDVRRKARGRSKKPSRRGRPGRDGSRVADSLDTDGPPLQQLPQDMEDVWEVDVRLMPSFIAEENMQPRRPWGLFIVSTASRRALGHDVRLDRPADAELAEAVVQCLRAEGRRPGAIEVTQPGLRAHILSMLGDASIDVRPRDGLRGIDGVVLMLTEKTCDLQDRQVLLRIPGVTPAIAAEFHAAAAVFHRARPWRRLPVDTAIRAVGGPARTPSVAAIVMGQSGVQQGLAIYDDESTLRAVLGKDDAAAKKGRGLSVLFGEACETLDLDLLAIEEHGFEIAAPEAYPEIVRVASGMRVQAPLSTDVELATRLLRAIPAFLDAVPRGGMVGWKSPCGLELSWE